MAALDGYIQMATRTQVLYGGYGRALGGGIAAGYSCTSGNCFTGDCNKVEAIDGSCGPAGITDGNWQDVSASGSNVSTYTFRNSNSALNSRSSLATVEVYNEWEAELGTDNKIIFHLLTKVTRVTTTDVRPNINPSIPQYYFNFGPNDGSGRALLPNPVAYSVIKDWDSQVSAPWIADDSYTLRRDFVLGAQETTAQAQIQFQSWSGVNGSGWNAGNIYWRDGFVMGALFRNNLPNYYPTPASPVFTQTPQVCNESVDLSICVPQPVIAGGRLELDWSYKENDYPAANRITVDTVNADGDFCALINNLVPSVCEPTYIYWRARFVSKTGSISPSAWVKGKVATMFVPPASMTVPDITTAECTAIGKGDLIDEFDKMAYYNNRKPACKKGKC